MTEKPDGNGGRGKRNALQVSIIWVLELSGTDFKITVINIYYKTFLHLKNPWHTLPLQE